MRIGIQAIHGSNLGAPLPVIGAYLGQFSSRKYYFLSFVTVNSRFQKVFLGFSMIFPIYTPETAFIDEITPENTPI